MHACMQVHVRFARADSIGFQIKPVVLQASSKGSNMLALLWKGHSYLICIRSAAVRAMG